MGFEAHGGCAGDAHHIGLGNAAVNGTVRLARKLGGADAAHKVGVQVQNVGVLLQEAANGLAQGLFKQARVFSPV